MRLCDFGLVRHVAHVQEKSSHNSVGTVMTDYVGCRWYRSPEVLLGSVSYLEPVDMWSLGCAGGWWHTCGGGVPARGGRSA